MSSISTIWLIILIIILLSLPYWLPDIVTYLRGCIFTWINGKEGIQIPNRNFGAGEFYQIYTNPAASGRSKGAGISDLFWYWLSPGPEMHQEHLENGDKYNSIAQFTRDILNVPRAKIEDLLSACIEQNLKYNSFKVWKLSRVRDLMMPIWADFYYELVFQEKPTPYIQKLIVGNANDVVTALKCCSLRHMKKRHALTNFLLQKLDSYTFNPPFPSGFSLQEQAYYIQGTFFNTAIVQMSDAMSHLIITLAQQSKVQNQMAIDIDNRELYNHVINETMRLFPLFGIAHRVLTDDIKTDSGVIEAGSVVCFNYPNYQKIGFDDAKTFKHDRWNYCSVKDSNYIPFGFTENRPCPAQGIATVTIRKLLQLMLKDYQFFSIARHSRSLPNRGPVLITKRNHPLSTVYRICILCFMKIRDDWEGVFRSILQLILGTIMVIHAKRLKLCTNYFKQSNAS